MQIKCKKAYFILLVMLSCLFCLSDDIFGQQKHAIYGELLGAGLIYNMNYDYRFSEDIRGPGLQVGFEYIPTGTSRNGGNFMAILARGNILIGKQPHFFEFAAGPIYIGGDASFLGDYSYDRRIGLSVGLGYRLQLKYGLLFKIGFSSTKTKEFTGSAWPGISLGYVF